MYSFELLNDMTWNEYFHFTLLYHLCIITSTVLSIHSNYALSVPLFPMQISSIPILQKYKYSLLYQFSKNYHLHNENTTNNLPRLFGRAPLAFLVIIIMYGVISAKFSSLVALVRAALCSCSFSRPRGLFSYKKRRRDRRSTHEEAAALHQRQVRCHEARE